MPRASLSSISNSSRKSLKIGMRAKNQKQISEKTPLIEEGRVGEGKVKEKSIIS